MAGIRILIVDFFLSPTCAYTYTKKQINDINSMLTNALCVPYIYRLTFLDMILEKSNKKLYQETIFSPMLLICGYTKHCSNLKVFCLFQP